MVSAFDLSNKETSTNKVTSANKASNVNTLPVTEIPIVKLYTDGACKGNPGKGGWAAYSYDGNIDISGHKPLTTNNEMELTAVLNVLIALPANSKVRIVTDSKLVIGWLSKGWKCNTNPKIPPMIKDCLRYRKEKNLDVEFIWIKGHNGDECNAYVNSVASRRCKG